MGIIWKLIKRKMAGKKLTINIKLTTIQVNDLKQNRQVGFYSKGIFYRINQIKYIDDGSVYYA